VAIEYSQKWHNKNSPLVFKISINLFHPLNLGRGSLIQSFNPYDSPLIFTTEE